MRITTTIVHPDLLRQRMKDNYKPKPKDTADFAHVLRKAMKARGLPK